MEISRSRFLKDSLRKVTHTVFIEDFMISSKNRKFQNSAKKFETAQIFVTDPLDQSLPENQDFGEQIWRYRDPGSLRVP